MEIVLEPADGRWDAPVVVWRDHFALFNLLDMPGTLARLEDHTGSTEPIALRGWCYGWLGLLATGDMLMLPLGNLGEDVTTTVAVRVFDQTVTDVDAYAGWGLPP